VVGGPSSLAVYMYITSRPVAVPCCALLCSGDGAAQLGSVVVVAHSIIIREIIRRCTVPGTGFSCTDLAAQLSQGKLENGGTVAIDIEFLDNHSTRAAQSEAGLPGALVDIAPSEEQCR
jgi:hypothetical protein